MFCGWSPRAHGMAREHRGCQKSRVKHKPSGTCPRLEQESPFLQAKKVRKKGDSWVLRAASEGADAARGGPCRRRAVSGSEWRV